MHTETIKKLNAKILNLTTNIKENYPELSKYLEEMPVTIPNEVHPYITIQSLKAYFESLTALVNGYLLEQHKSTN